METKEKTKEDILLNLEKLYEEIRNGWIFDYSGETIRNLYFDLVLKQKREYNTKEELIEEINDTKENLIEFIDELSHLIEELDKIS